MTPRSRLSVFLLLAASCWLVSFRCTNLPSAGNSTQIGNGMVAGVLLQRDGKTPAKGAIVYLRKKNTLANIPGAVAKRLADTSVAVATDNNGKFVIDSIDTGVYVIEGTDGRNNVALYDSVAVKSPDSTVKLPPDTLKPAGAIKGVIRLSEGGDPRKAFVLAFGLDRFASVDSNGRFTFSGLAESKYDLRIASTIDAYDVFDTSNIRVKSGDTTTIDTIALRFTGIPTPKNATASLDTMRQLVTVRWNRLDTALAKSYNVYRRNINPDGVFSVPANIHPVIDTFFIDSNCSVDETYEYRIVALDKNLTEGVKSGGVQIRIATYAVSPLNFAAAYDTVNQSVKLSWTNPDTSLVTGFLIYRRDKGRGETYWNQLSADTMDKAVFIDSNLITVDSIGKQETTWEYCVTAVIKHIREGVKSAALPIKTTIHYLIAKNLTFSYDTSKLTVTLRWSRPISGLVTGFKVLRRNADLKNDYFNAIGDLYSNMDTIYSDSSVDQSNTYEYCIGSLFKNASVEVKSAAIKVRIASNFTIDTLFKNAGSGQGQLHFPSDFAVASDGDIYIVDNGNNRIAVFDSAMHFKRQFGNAIAPNLRKISVDENGKAFVLCGDSVQGQSSIFVFSPVRTPAPAAMIAGNTLIDTIRPNEGIQDIDAKDSAIYALANPNLVSIYPYNGMPATTLILNEYGGRAIIKGDTNTIFFCAYNSITIMNLLGQSVYTTSTIGVAGGVSSIDYDKSKQSLYAACMDWAGNPCVYAFDKSNTMMAKCKIPGTNAILGLQKSGVLLVMIPESSHILRLKLRL